MSKDLKKKKQALNSFINTELRKKKRFEKRNSVDVKIGEDKGLSNSLNSTHSADDLAQHKKAGSANLTLNAFANHSHRGGKEKKSPRAGNKIGEGALQKG